MNFSNPLVLLALAFPILIGAWTLMRRGREVAMPFDSAQPRSGIVIKVMVSAAELLPCLLLAVVILILAGPFRWQEPAQKRRLTNIEFCVDISGSMTAPFGPGTRYDASMEAINEFLDYREGDAFGLTFFGNNVMHWVPLTNDTSAFRCAPPFMRPENRIRGFGGTEIGKALLACRDVLVQREEGDRMIVLVSDGASADLSGGNDEVVAKKLVKDGIVVFAIHIAESEPPAGVVTITNATGGEVFAVGDPTALDQVFSRIDEMQVTELEKTTAESLDHFGIYCVIGLSIMGLFGLTAYGLRYTPW